MAFNTLIASVVKTVDNVTGSMQVKVTHKAFGTQDVFGAQTPKATVVRKAVVEYRQEQVKTFSGEIATSRAYILFPRPVNIDSRDMFILPDGSTGPILTVGGGVLNPATNKGYVAEVWLG